MIIRRKQVDTFAEESKAEFENRIKTFLHQEFPDSREINEAEYALEVRNQIGKARAYGLETEQQIATYVVVAYALGTDFDTRLPAAQQVLPSPSLTPNEKVRWLDNWNRTLFAALEEKG